MPRIPFECAAQLLGNESGFGGRRSHILSSCLKICYKKLKARRAELIVRSH